MIEPLLPSQEPDVMSPAFPPALALALLVIGPSVVVAQSGTAQVNGVSLPYEITGEGTALVLIHGWAVHRGYWDDDVQRLARHHQVIRYDRRGFGQASGRPDITADPADLKALLDRLGVARAHVLGHSQGAGVALTFAVRYPDMVDAIVLFGPAPLPGQELAASDDLPAFGDWIVRGKTYGVDSLHAAIGQGSSEQAGPGFCRPSVAPLQARVNSRLGLSVN
jgi:pimeloyl-ACP methyl ester carboxylesterase